MTAIFLLCAMSIAACGGTARIENGVYFIVPPVDDHTAPAEIDQVRTLLYDSIEKQGRFLLSGLHPWKQDQTLMLLTESGSSEHFVRPNCGTVQGLCFLYRFGDYDPDIVGLTRRELLKNKIIPMIRYLCATHETGICNTDDNARWGRSWQSALWATMLGRGAWWIWSDLPADLHQAMRRLIAWEADAIAERDPPHQVTQNTRAEENAWNSAILSVAQLLMPEDPRRTVWEKALQRWTLNSFLSPADVRSETVVDGRPVRLQYVGANIHSDFTLENHNRIHPDYMAAFVLSTGSALDFAMTGHKPPESLFYNVDGLYENIKWFSLPTGELIYPQGQDWELQRCSEWAYMHILAACQMGDPQAWSLMKPCLKATRLLQARNPSGTVYRDNEYFFPSFLSDLFYQHALAWLNLHYHQPIVDAPKTLRGVRLLDEGRCILNRTATSCHTVSWGGRRMMAQISPLTPDRLIEPQYASGTGYLRLADRNEPEFRYLRSVDVSSGENTFQVTWKLRYGYAVQADQTFQSMADGSFRIKEKLIALDNIETDEIATGLIAILNNIDWMYENGRRVITVNDKRHEMIAGKEKDFHETGITRVNIDDIIRVRSAGPLEVLYRGAREMWKTRRIDQLYLNYIGGRHPWKKGQTISEYDITMQCAKPSSGS